MSTHDRRSDEDLVGHLTAVLWHMLPEVLPDVTSFPTATRVIDGIPVAKVVGSIPPWDTSMNLETAQLR
jgi:hypothetical protein